MRKSSLNVFFSIRSVRKGSKGCVDSVPMKDHLMDISQVNVMMDIKSKDRGLIADFLQVNYWAIMFS